MSNFTIEDLKCIKEKLTADEGDIINKINKHLRQAEQNKDVCVWLFRWDLDREGLIESIFTATKEEVDRAIGNEVYFGEVLGKHSEIHGTLEKGDIYLISENPIDVIHAEEVGLNPLEYAIYECLECGDYFGTDELDRRRNICDYCADEYDNAN